MAYRLVILTTTINSETVEQLVAAARAESELQNAEIIDVIKTVGCLDMPVIAQKVLANEQVDGLVVLGAVAKGETKHDELVVNVMTQSITQLSLIHHKPVGFGVIGPGASPDQFKKRTDEYARRAVQAVVRNLELLRNSN